MNGRGQRADTLLVSDLDATGDRAGLSKREVHTQPAARPESCQLLMRRPCRGTRLRRDGQRGVSVAIVEECARQPIYANSRVVFGYTSHAYWRATADQIQGIDRVRTEVVQRAATSGRIVAHVGGIQELLRKYRMRRANWADRVTRDEIENCRPLRMVAVAERFFDVPAGAIASAAETFDVA